MTVVKQRLIYKLILKLMSIVINVLDVMRYFANVRWNLRLYLNIQSLSQNVLLKNFNM